MIQLYTYRLTPPDREKATAAINTHAELMAARSSPLRGFKMEPDGEKDLLLTMRLAGLTRFHIAHDAPRILNIFLRKARLTPAMAKFEALDSPPTRRNLRDGQGRTERSMRPYAERRAAGKMWDRVEWDWFTSESRRDGSGEPSAR